MNHKAEMRALIFKLVSGIIELLIVIAVIIFIALLIFDSKVTAGYLKQFTDFELIVMGFLLLIWYKD